MRKVHGSVGFLCGVPCGALGAALMRHGSFGMTPFYSVSLALYEATKCFTMGAWNALFQLFLIVLLMLLLRKIRIRYLLSFAVGAVSSMLIDLFHLYIQNWPDTIGVRVLCFAAGLVVMCFSIAILAACKLPVAPMNLFVRELSQKLGRTFGAVKLYFDFSCLCLAVCVGLLIVGKLPGIGIGTVAAACFTGPLSGVFLQLQEKHIIFYR